MSPTDLPNAQNLAFIEELYAQYLDNRSSVSDEWQSYFEKNMNGETRAASVRGPSFQKRSIFNPASGGGSSMVTEEIADQARLQDRVNQLIRNYRVRGHMIAKIDPLGRPRPVPRELELDFFNFSENDFKQKIACEAIRMKGEHTIHEIVDHLRATYCRSIGVQYMHIDDIHVRRWLQTRMEGTENRLRLTHEEQIRILTRLTDAVTFEEFLHKKFIGAKSFSLDGCESLIPLLDLAIDHSGGQGTKEIVLAMAHRGRLNVLANIMGKPPKQIFREFADKDAENYEGRGDVKYHLGHSCDFEVSNGNKVHLSLCFNPSHLEFVNTVAMGRTRAKQDRVDDHDHENCMCLLIHGDAAFIGEGVSQETLNLSQLPGYTVGGTLHVVVNNQIGFTTSPDEGRSSAYATDIAKMLQIPIFHVNGEDPEAVAQVVRLALDFRKTFKRDVVIDMYGYRRLGHNETDEASFTQPLMYREIAKRESVLEGYMHHLLKLDEVTEEEADQIQQERRELLEKHLNQSRRKNYKAPKEKLRGIWSRSNYVGGEDIEEIDTGITSQRLGAMLEMLTRVPRNFTPHPKIKKLLETRLDMSHGDRPLDWAAAEAGAFASLSLEGYRIRLSGQDCRRGTFSHRHAALYDYQDGLPYIPLQHLAPGQQKPVEIYNSPLSETGVLGFDYGYSLDCPDGLVLWEAQFGDFANAAQVIIDQFITSAEDKWRRLSGLVMLLPHAFEGMGPEHSSARLERFLVLAAENNIQVMNLTTPAQYFHALRRQGLRRWRKPLVIMSPKSLLRHPKAVSELSSFEQGRFQRIIPDETITAPSKVKRAILCSGKIYYELLTHREQTGHEKDTAIVRLEQLYPLNPDDIEQAFAAYKQDVPVYWVQEEPENMGAWRYMRAGFGEKLPGGHPFAGIARPESASPATGSANSHKQEQLRILDEAMNVK